MNIVTVATLKGGNGKTTTSLAIAAVLAGRVVRGGRPLRLASAKQREAFLDRGSLGVDFAVVDTAPGEVELVDAALPSLGRRRGPGRAHVTHPRGNWTSGRSDAATRARAS